jgi:hypothetical protein
VSSPALVVVLADCPHCEGAGSTKRGKQCRSCRGSGGHRTDPPTNARHGGGRFTGSKRIKAERRATRARLEAAAELVGPPALPVTARFIRVAPAFLDDDNLRGSFKAHRDELADWLGLKSDRDPRARWRYGQAKAGRGVYRAEIQIFRGLADCECCGQPIIPPEQP